MRRLCWVPVAERGGGLSLAAKKKARHSGRASLERPRYFGGDVALVACEAVSGNRRRQASTGCARNAQAPSKSGSRMFSARWPRRKGVESLSLAEFTMTVRVVGAGGV